MTNTKLSAKTQNKLKTLAKARIPELHLAHLGDGDAAELFTTTEAQVAS